MAGPNPSDMDMEIFILPTTFCLQPEKVYSINWKTLNIPLVEKIRRKTNLMAKYDKKILNEERIENFYTIITGSISAAAHQSLLFTKEEKLEALLVYSSFIRVAISGFRIIP